MATSAARRLGRSRPGPIGPDERVAGEADGLGAQARASHLKNAARSAGEAFAWSADEPAAAPRSRGRGSTALWLAAGAAAALGLYVAF